MVKKQGKKNIVNTFCRMCDDHCGLNVHLLDGKVIDIDGYAEHPWNKGRVCSKGRAAVDMIYAADRITKPLKRTKDGWQEIDLETALDEIAEKIKKIQKEYGNRSMSIWKGEATGFNQQEELARRFCHALGTPNYFSNDSACSLGRLIGYSLVYGIWAVPDYVNSECIIIWGANPPATHPHMTRMIMEGKAKGAKLIVIDPRLSMIARQADIHANLRAGTDGALAWGIIHLLIKNNWYDKDFVEQYTVGFDKILVYAEKFTPAFVAEETGIKEDIIVEITRQIHKASPRVVTYVGNGPEHHENGINNIRAISHLDALTGAFDQKGGALHCESLGVNRLSLYEELPLKELGPIGVDRFPVLYDFHKECHTMTGMDVILSGKPYPIKGMILTGANPVMTNPNTLKVQKALSSLDLLVVRDLFMSETAKLAHYVLPAASFLERSELHCHGMFQIVNLSKRIFALPEVQDEYQFWHDMAHRLGFGEYFPWENETELNKWLLEPTGIILDELAVHPEGYQYKPRRYRKFEKEPFNTPSGKVEFASAYLKGLGFEEIAEYKSPAYLNKPDSEYPFVMITGARTVLYYLSRNHNFSRFQTAQPAPYVEIHPDDAKKLGLKDGESVRVTSRIGSLEIKVRVMAENEILPGTIQITHGWKEANVNLITHDDIFDPIDGFPLMKSVEVKIEKI